MADWEIYMKNELESELRPQQSGDRHELAILAIIRDYLRLDDDKLGTTVADQAAQRIRDCYHKAYLDEDEGWYFRRDDDHGASSVTQTVSAHVWEMALQFPETDIRHTALVNLLVTINRDSPNTEFDPKNPQLVFSKGGLEEIAWEQYDKEYVINISSIQTEEGLATKCARSIRSFAFRAKLLTAGVLDASDLDLVFRRMRDYLAEPGESVNDLAWSGRISTAAQPILLSGEAVAKEAKEPSQKHHDPVNAEVWQRWALKLKKESLSHGKEDRWDARDKAARAYARMIELWPDAFPERSAE